MGQGTSPLSPAERDPPPGGTPGQPQTQSRKEC
nr:MAG TPA: hypothetical protein [Inoviridae sp.]